ncbi:Uncharacterised protein [Mycobacterium tuberculosis]|uniref:Uncharacterized protein n=1 Tax=Mycobacterium tuberculosis TaxID=1773 RepID=A0A655AQX9_MYCTX|nr:Uncharacterised protein [Mycobacterium tuberculosis]
MVAGGVLTLGFGGIKLALAALGAEHREFDADLVQRANGLVVTFAQQLDGVGGLGQLGGYRVRRRSCELVGQVDHSLLGRLQYPQVGLGLGGELIVAHGRPLTGQPSHGRTELGAFGGRCVL